MAKHRRRRSRSLGGLGALTPLQLGLGVVVIGGIAAWFFLRKKDEKKPSAALPDAAQAPASEAAAPPPAQTVSDAELAAMVSSLTDAELVELSKRAASGMGIGEGADALTPAQVKTLEPFVNAELAKRTTVPAPSSAAAPPVDVAVDPGAARPDARSGVTDMRATRPGGRGRGTGRRFPGLLPSALQNRLRRLQKAREANVARRAAVPQFPSQTSSVNVDFKF